MSFEIHTKFFLAVGVVALVSLLAVLVLSLRL